MCTTANMSAAPINDPLERRVASALSDAGIAYVHEMQDQQRTGLDFYLPESGVYVEVKRFHSDRISKQTARAENIIVLQGEQAVDLFCNALQMSVKGN